MLQSWENEIIKVPWSLEYRHLRPEDKRNKKKKYKKKMSCRRNRQKSFWMIDTTFSALLLPSFTTSGVGFSAFYQPSSPFPPSTYFVPYIILGASNYHTWKKSYLIQVIMTRAPNCQLLVLPSMVFIGTTHVTFLSNSHREISYFRKVQSQLETSFDTIRWL